MSEKTVNNSTDNLFSDYADVVTVNEVAKMLRIGRGNAYRLVNSGHIESIKVGSQIRVPKVCVIEFLKNRMD